MEEDNFRPDCDNIRKQIKSFMEDMLKEEEFQEFLGHLEKCPECKKYVRSVDSFSNQLWRLGDVKVPSDFESTVLFELTQPVKKPKKQETDEASAGSRKWLIGGVTVILVTITLAAGLISYFKLKKSPEQETAVVQLPAVTQEAVFDRGDDDADQAENVSVAFEEPQEEIAFGLVDLDQDAAAEADLGPQLIHWHFLQYDKSKELEALRLRRKKRKLESDQASEEEIQAVETKLEQNRIEKNKRAGEPLNILKSLGIRPDYQDSDFVLFSARGDEVGKIIEEIAVISKGDSSLNDFTPLSDYSPERRYQVSVYLLKQKTSVLHWHVHLSMVSQMNQLLKTIQDYGGVITYEFAEEVTFSISSRRIDDLKAQMPAMRISLSEYGEPATNTGVPADYSEAAPADGEEEAAPVPASGPVVISIYFAK